MKAKYMARSNLKKKKNILPMATKFWKEEIDKKWFSRYVRLLYDESGYCRCVTCGKKINIKSVQAGHYIPRLVKSRYDLKNVHPQCLGCNVFKKGNQLPYQDFIIKKYGKNKNKQLRKLADKNIHFKNYNRQTMRKFAIWLQKECIRMDYTRYWKKEKELKYIK